MTERDPSIDLFFENINTDKQIRYEERVARQLLKLWGVPASTSSWLQRKAAKGAADRIEGFTPEWISEYYNCPIYFKAYKDYAIDKDEHGEFLSPADSLWYVPMGPKWNRVWVEMWESFRESMSDSGECIAVCFKPCWARATMVVHDYAQVLDSRKMRGMYLSYRDDQGRYFMHYLRDLIPVLLEHWRPELYSS